MEDLMKKRFFSWMFGIGTAPFTAQILSVLVFKEEVELFYFAISLVWLLAVFGVIQWGVKDE